MISARKLKKLAEATADDVLEKLEVNPDEGLSSNEAANRQESFGKNAIESEKRNPLKEFFSHFWGPIPWMIEVAVILSAIAGRWEDFAVILIMLIINGGVGYWQESKASNAIEALKNKLAPESVVLRNSNKKTINSDELVPGDIVILKMGDIVPADLKLLKNQHITIDESALTGESVPVDKNENENAYSGTTVKRGEAKAVVIATGNSTKFAQTVELVEEAEEKSHFQRAVIRIGYFLIAITGLLVAAIIVTGIVREEKIMDVLLFALVVTIAGIPQALPAVLSVTMTIGARRLARKKAIVSRLSAMEEMAGLETLCADKTGTLTKNQLELQDPVIIEAESKKEVLVSAALTAKENTDDPIDSAILTNELKEELSGYKIIDFKGFNPTDKRAESRVKHKGKEYTVTKGAPQVILELLNGDESIRKKVNKTIDELGEQGYRTLGVAKKNNGTWHYLGLLPLLDPPREDSKEVIQEARENGVDIRMVTGDHTAIAKQVSKQLSLKQNILKADQFFDKESQAEKNDKNDLESELNKKFLEADGFAEVTPEHKFKIIKQFQKNNRIVGMTGDGINDAPALKQADIGIAVSNATDAARSAAALVLTKPGLGVIIKAIEEARRIFERMTGYATFRITESLAVLLFMALSIILFRFYPVTPIMVVLLAILNDIPIMTIAFDNVKTSPTPVRWDMKRVLTIASVLSIGSVISSLILFWYILNQLNFNSDIIQTMMFLKLLVAGHMTIFLTRNTGWMWEKPLPDKRLFIALEGTQILGTLFAVYGWFIHPIGWAKAGIVWAYALVWLVVFNALKVVTIKMVNRFTQ